VREFGPGEVDFDMVELEAELAVVDTGDTEAADTAVAESAVAADVESDKFEDIAQA
jgi:hypothetical protein